VGRAPKAFVTLKPGQRATEAEIIEFCRQHIAHFKCPAAVEFGDLPKTSTGKVQKFVLRDKEWKGQAKRSTDMSLEQTLNDTLTKAMREKDARTADIVRMIKSKIGERRTAKGFSGQVDDALVLDVIGAYRKSFAEGATGLREGRRARPGAGGSAPPRDRVPRALAAQGAGRRRPPHPRPERLARSGHRRQGRCGGRAVVQPLGQPAPEVTRSRGGALPPAPAALAGLLVIR